VPDAAEVTRGLDVYKQHCADCHGYRPIAAEPTTVEPWVAKGKYLHKLEGVGPMAPPDGGLGVDAERVTFRYAHDLPLAIWTSLPGNPEIAAVQEERLNKAIQEAQESKAPALAYFWQKQKDKFQLARRQYRLGHPLYFPVCKKGGVSVRHDRAGQWQLRP
jgi:hypothetical protein